MKIDIASDLHLEFGTIKLNNENNSDVLCLNGDICVLKDYDKYEGWFKSVAEAYKHVLYIAGNHEFYGYHIEKALNTAYTMNIDNLHFLNNDSIIIDDVKFIGGTLWTDMNKEDPTDIFCVNYGMNDFRVIKYNKYTFSAHNAIQLHKETLQFFKDELSKDFNGKSIIMSHHAPSSLSVEDEYKNSNINAGYYSDLSEFILEHQPLKWFHGHMHHKTSYYIGDTEVICNPRGYIGHEKIATDFQIQTIEV